MRCASTFSRCESLSASSLLLLLARSELTLTISASISFFGTSVALADGGASRRIGVRERPAVVTRRPFAAAA